MVWGWIKSALGYFGLFQKKASILFLGLDNAGKTSLLRVLRDDKVVTDEPTKRAYHEELTIDGVKFCTHDVGGHFGARQSWRNYFGSIDAVVFIVDAADEKRMEEAEEELSNLLTDDELADTPFLIFGNKIDLVKKAVNEDTLRESLQIQTTGKKNTKLEDGVRPIEVFMCSVAKKAGYAKGFQWLSQHI